MTDNYADYPLSLAEIVSDREQDGSKWTPRDALISMLRDIDSGKRSVTALIICTREEQEEGRAHTGYMQSSRDVQVSLGMLERVKHLINADEG